MNTPTRFLQNIILVACVIFSGSVSLAQDCTDTNDCFLQAGQKGNTLEAVAFYDKAEAMWPDLGDTTMLYHIYSGRGNVYNSLKDFSNALQDYNKIIQLRPTDMRILSVAYTSRGNVMSSNGNQKGAIASFTKSIELYPPNMIALTNRCFGYLELGMVEEGLADLKNWADLGSQRALSILKSEFQIDYSEQQKTALASDEQWQAIETERKRAKALSDDKKYQEAYELYIKVFDMYGERKDSESQAPICTEMAYVQNKMEDYFRAASWASRAVYGSYANNLSFIELAKAFKGQGDVNQAINVCNNGLQVFPGSPSISDYGHFISQKAAYDAYMAKDYASSYEYYYTAYDFVKSDVESIIYAGHSAYNLREYKAALKCYDIAVSIKPSIKSELEQFINYCRSVSN